MQQRFNTLQQIDELSLISAHFTPLFCSLKNPEMKMRSKKIRVNGEWFRVRIPRGVDENWDSNWKGFPSGSETVISHDKLLINVSVSERQTQQDSHACAARSTECVGSWLEDEREENCKIMNESWDDLRV